MNTRISAVVIVSASLLGAACGQQPVEVVAGAEPGTATTITTAEPGSRPTSTLGEAASADTTAEVPKTQPADSAAAPDPDPDPTPALDPRPGEKVPRETDWTDHELASLVLTPDAMGDEWVLDDVDVVEAEPARGDDFICGVAEPDQLDGLEVEMSLGDNELVQVIGQGTEAEAQSWLSAFEALAVCDGSEEFGFIDATTFVPNVNGADTVAGVDFVLSDSDPASIRFVGARFGSVFVFVIVAADSPESLQSIEWMADQVAWSGAQL